MAEYRLGFTAASHPLTQRLYQALRENGMTDADLDCGAAQINYAGIHCPKKSAPSCVKGAGDGVIDGAEVFERAFQLAGQSERYRQLLEGTLGLQLPWALDDLDPATTFDEKVWAKIQSTLTFLETFLQEKGMMKGSPAYQEALAVGLFYLVATPDPEQIAQRRERFDEVTRELETLGWTAYKTYLLQHGGLRPVETADDILTALEVMEWGKQNSSSLTLLLYGVLVMAGLPVSFMLVQGKDAMKDPVFRKMLTQGASVKGTGLYGCVGLATPHGIRLMDPALGNSNAPYPHFFSSSPCETMADVYIGRGIRAEKNRDLPRAREQYAMAREVDPGSPWPHGRLALLAADAKEWDQVRKHCDEALRLAPDQGLIYAICGQAMRQQAHWAEAAADLTEALRHDASNVSWLERRGEAYGSLGSWDKAVADYAQVLRHGLRRQEEVAQSIGQVVTKRWAATPAVEALRQKIVDEFGGIDPAAVEHALLLSRVLWTAGSQQTAKAMIADVLTALPKGKPFSEPVRRTIRQILTHVPLPLRRDAKIAAAMKAIVP